MCPMNAPDSFAVTLPEVSVAPATTNQPAGDSAPEALYGLAHHVLAALARKSGGDDDLPALAFLLEPAQVAVLALVYREHLARSS